MSQQSQQPSGSGQSIYYAGLAAVAIVIVVALFFLFRGKDEITEPVALPPPAIEATPEVATLPELEPEVVEPENSAEAAQQVPAETTPIVTAPQLPPLPALDESDKAVTADLLALKWKAGLAALFNQEDMIRHFVVTVDNVAQGQLVAGHQVLVAPKGAYLVDTLSDDRFQVTEDNAQRYEPYIQLLESVPARQLLALKQRYQPLLDEAFAELGYPDITFDQRLRQALDVLLSTPSVPPAELARPSVMYTYADPALEALPEAQKQVLRLSASQQQRFKATLKAYQQALGN